MGGDNGHSHYECMLKKRRLLKIFDDAEEKEWEMGVKLFLV